MPLRSFHDHQLTIRKFLSLFLLFASISPSVGKEEDQLHLHRLARLLFEVVPALRLQLQRLFVVAAADLRATVSNSASFFKVVAAGRWMASLVATLGGAGIPGRLVVLVIFMVKETTLVSCTTM